MRIDGLTAEDEIPGTHDVDMQRIGDTLRNVHRAGPDDSDMNRTVDFGSAEITCPRDIEMQPAVDRAHVRGARTGDIGMDIGRRTRLDFAGARNIEMQIACDIGNRDLARTRHAQMRFFGAADPGVRRDGLEMHIAHRVADRGVTDHVAHVDVGSFRHHNVNVEVLGAVVNVLEVEPVLPIPNGFVVLA
ncbi:MAG: hypothetical protein WDM89_09385 [Rhizomicrobium sp.]